jgi:Protein kinase domain
MSLSSGSKIGAYEILSPLGGGGTEEVYRARDTKVNREIAIKVLADGFSQDPDRLARFQREAELLATLNHPNVAAIYGLEKTDGPIPLVEGVRRVANNQTGVAHFSVSDTGALVYLPGSGHSLRCGSIEQRAKGGFSRDGSLGDLRVKRLKRAGALQFRVGTGVCGRECYNRAQHFVILVPPKPLGKSEGREIEFVLNRIEELKARVPAK